MAQDQEIVSLQLLSYDPSQDRLPIRYEIARHFLLAADVRPETVHFLRFVQDLDERAHVVVLQLRDWQVYEVEGVQRLVRLLVDKLELDDQDILLQLGLLIGRHRILTDLRQLPRLLLVQYAVLQVCLRERRVHLVDLLYAYVLRNDTVPRQHGLPLIAHVPLLGPHRRVARGPAAFGFRELVGLRQRARPVRGRLVKGLGVQIQVRIHRVCRVVKGQALLPAVLVGVTYDFAGSVFVGGIAFWILGCGILL